MKTVISFFAMGLAAALLLYVAIHGIPFPTPKQKVNLTPQIQEAEAFYLQGEKAQTISDRKHSFNLAFQKYKQLETRYHPEYGNGKLYYDLANASYQLEEYPWAIYYYYKALKLMPQSDEARHNLSLALQKLDLPAPKEESTFGTLFFFHHYLSLPERLSLFFFSGLLTLFLASVWIWRPWTVIKIALALAAVVCLLFMGSVLYSRYLAPLEGVLVKSALLYRDAGEQYAKVSEKPLPAGIKVQVLDMRQQGHWVKVLTSDGTLGYTTSDTLGLL